MLCLVLLTLLVLMAIVVLLVMVISLVMLVLLTVSAFAVLEIRPLAFARFSHLRAVSCADGCDGFTPSEAFRFVVPVLMLVFLHITPRSPPPCEKTKKDNPRALRIAL